MWAILSRDVLDEKKRTNHVLRSLRRYLCAQLLFVISPSATADSLNRTEITRWYIRAKFFVFVFFSKKKSHFYGILSLGVSAAERSWRKMRGKTDAGKRGGGREIGLAEAAIRLNPRINNGNSSCGAGTAVINYETIPPAECDLLPHVSHNGVCASHVYPSHSLPPIHTAGGRAANNGQEARRRAYTSNNNGNLVSG